MSIEIKYCDDYESVVDTYCISIGAEATGSDTLAAFIRVMQAAGYSNVTIYRALEEQLSCYRDEFGSIIKECQCQYQGGPPTVSVPVPVPEDEAEAAWEEFKELLKEKMS